MLRLYRFPYSTNVDRVALAMGHKGIEPESVVIDFADRSEVRRVSGQDLVPVIDHDGRVVHDSTEIIRYLEEAFPSPALYPADPARRAEMEVFIDWFNRVWKRPPNDIEAEMGKPEPDRQRIEQWGRQMTDRLDLFESMLEGRDYIMGDELSAADCCAWPFLRYALWIDDDDGYLFHDILVEWMPLGDGHPNLERWIRHVRDSHPRV